MSLSQQAGEPIGSLLPADAKADSGCRNAATGGEVARKAADSRACAGCASKTAQRRTP